jgi:hypothetical protein
MKRLAFDLISLMRDKRHAPPPPPPTGETAALVALYQEAAHQLISSQNELWTSLYYALVANSILVLAWAAAFVATVSNQTQLLRSIFLLVVSGVGLAIATIWLIVAERLMSYFPGFWQSVLGFERAILTQAARTNTENVPGVYGATSQHWEKLSRRRMKRPGTHALLLFVHGGFLVLYLSLLLLSILAVISP